MHSRLIKISEIDSIDENFCGIYSWLLLPKRLTPEKLVRLKSSFSQLEVKLKGSSTLNKFSEIYSAEFRRDESYIDTSLYAEYELDFIKEVLSQITIPLYVGRSINLKNRLNQHWKNYINARSDLREKESYCRFENLDSDEESNYFGFRLADFNSDNWFGESELSIKIFYENSKTNNHSIKRVEYFLNRYYKPILGLI
jgi:hypothetical protein